MREGLRTPWSVVEVNGSEEEAINSIQALHWTPIPLRSIGASELYRWADTELRGSNGRFCR
ncbi:MAG TPA: hypothetical protein ENJ35_10930 [Gammaproteobacteria bacterium]|nr:hypothetical protein [Gammaproteobacteria bacterium]